MVLLTNVFWQHERVATIAFLGLGNMGLGMAQRLLQAGHSLRVYNRTASKADELESAGARRYATPREACTDVEAVFTMTADDISRSVWWDPTELWLPDSRPYRFRRCSTLSIEGQHCRRTPAQTFVLDAPSPVPRERPAC